MNTPISDLKKKGFISLAYPGDLRKAVNQTVKLWKQFCDLPDEVKTGLPYSNNGAGMGYEMKNGIGQNADRKENFDVTLATEDWLVQNSAQIENPVALSFVRAAANLVNVMQGMILDFAGQVEQEFSLVGFRQEVADGKKGFFVRFIHYFGDRKVEEETANAHNDQSGFTLHLFESAPGLQCLTYDRQWIDMPVDEGQTVIIPAMQLQLRSEGVLRALCHRVIANMATAVGGRYSAVCFVQLQSTAKYNKDANGRLQEKEPGFSYDMTHEQFAKMFQ